MALTLQFYGLRRSQVADIAHSAGPFANISETDLDQLLDYMVSIGVLIRADGLLVLGAAGEKRYGRQNFMDLYAVFETPEEITVISPDRRVIGTLETWFVQQLSGEGGFVFLLAGRAWQAQHVDLEQGQIIAVSAPKGANTPLEEADLHQALDQIRAPDFFSTERVLELVRSIPRGRLSKFQPLLPPDLEARFLAERLFDAKGLQRWFVPVNVNMSSQHVQGAK